MAKPSKSPPEVDRAAHDDQSVRSPEVVLEEPSYDFDGGKTRWALGPHFNFALRPNIEQSQMEPLIDDALGGGYAETLNSVLQELKRLQAEPFNSAGKAECAALELDPVQRRGHEYGSCRISRELPVLDEVIGG